MNHSLFIHVLILPFGMNDYFADDKTCYHTIHCIIRNYFPKEAVQVTSYCKDFIFVIIQFKQW